MKIIRDGDNDKSGSNGEMEAVWEGEKERKKNKTHKKEKM